MRKYLLFILCFSALCYIPCSKLLAQGKIKNDENDATNANVYNEKEVVNC